MDAYDFRSTLTSDGLVAEVAAGTFAFKNKLKAHSVKLIWDKLGIFVAETLKAQKGVLLPNLGSFKVGPVVGEARKKIRVAFSLLEGRYGPVSQERPRFLVGGKAPVVQPNYALLSQGAGVHRGIGQRLLAELLQRLGVHILSSRAIKVEFPHLGKLVTNRAGRIEFIFDALFAEYFERECYAVIKEMPYSPVDYDLQSHMEDMALHDQDKKRSSPAVAPVSSRMPVTKSVKRPGHPSYKAPLDKLLALCRSADRTIAGCVPRLRMEGWLQEHCSEQLAGMSGAALMNLLDRFTYGKNSKQIMYGQFLDALDEALTASTHYRAPELAHVHNAALDGYRQARADVADGGEHNAVGDEPSGDSDGIMRAEATATDLRVHPPYSPPAAPLQQAVSHTLAHMEAAPGLPGAPRRPPPTPDAYLHYIQNKLSPRSRADYDAFNRAHFQQLDAVRGRRLPASTLHRAVTPKVGQDLLNVREFEAVRSASPPRAVQSAAARPPPWAGSGQVPYSPAPPPPRPPATLPAWASQPDPAGTARTPGMSLPQRYTQHNPQVLSLLHPDDSSMPSPPPKTAQRSLGPGHKQAYDILAPPPMPPAHRVPLQLVLSQYDIARETDPEMRAQLKAQYAAALQTAWTSQIQEKEDLEQVLHMKEASWPYAPVHVPMDKRPPSAISKPPTVALSPRAR